MPKGLTSVSVPISLLSVQCEYSAVCPIRVPILGPMLHGFVTQFTITDFTVPRVHGTGGCAIFRNEPIYLSVDHPSCFRCGENGFDSKFNLLAVEAYSFIEFISVENRMSK